MVQIWHADHILPTPDLELTNFTCKSRLAVASLLSFVADAATNALRLAIFRACRNVTGRTLEVLVALTIAARAQTRSVTGTGQVMALARAGINTKT